MIHPLLPMPELTKESDAVYAILGPALAYATEFENNCLTLAHLFDIEKSDSEFSYEIYKLVNSGTLHEKIKLLVDEHGLPDWVEEKIHEARNARNFIAHEAAQDHKRMMSTPQLIKNFETTIMLMTGKIAHGNQIVLEVTRMLKEGKRRCRCIFICYGVVDWPCRLLIRHCSRKISDCVLTLPLSTTLGERRKFLVSLEVRKNKDAYLSVFLSFCANRYIARAQEMGFKIFKFSNFQIFKWEFTWSYFLKILLDAGRKKFLMLRNLSYYLHM